MPQSGEGLRVTGTAVPGGTITINVGPNDCTVEVSTGGGSNTVSYKIPGNKDTPIPVPPAAPGSTVVITVGKGSRQRLIILIVNGATP
jgi:phage tail sheath gpL-like